jgi:hypothetical protein
MPMAILFRAITQIATDTERGQYTFVSELQEDVPSITSPKTYTGVS